MVNCRPRKRIAEEATIGEERHAMSLAAAKRRSYQDRPYRALCFGRAPLLRGAFSSRRGRQRRQSPFGPFDFLHGFPPFPRWSDGMVGTKNLRMALRRTSLESSGVGASGGGRIDVRREAEAVGIGRAPSFARAICFHRTRLRRARLPLDPSLVRFRGKKLV